MLVSEDYPWGKLLREYATYCAVGCINVAIFAALYYWLHGMTLSERFPAATAWAIAYFVSSWQAGIFMPVAICLLCFFTNSKCVPNVFYDVYSCP